MPKATSVHQNSERQTKQLAFSGRQCLFCVMNYVTVVSTLAYHAPHTLATDKRKKRQQNPYTANHPCLPTPHTKGLNKSSVETTAFVCSQRPLKVPLKGWQKPALAPLTSIRALKLFSSSFVAAVPFDTVNKSVRNTLIASRKTNLWEPRLKAAALFFQRSLSHTGQRFSSSSRGGVSRPTPWKKNWRGAATHTRTGGFSRLILFCCQLKQREGKFTAQSCNWKAQRRRKISIGASWNSCKFFFREKQTFRRPVCFL